MADRVAAAVGAPAVGERLEGQMPLLPAPVGVRKKRGGARCLSRSRPS